MIFGRDIAWECRYALLWCDFGVMFNFGFAEMFSAAIFETCLYHKDAWIAVIKYYMYFCLTVQSPLKAILQLRNFAFS